MQLRTKTFLFILLSISLLLVALFVALRLLVSDSFTRNEDHSMRERVLGISTVTTQLLDEYSERFSDWSAWDDTANFVRSGNPSYVTDNLTTTGLKDQLQLQYFYLFGAAEEEKLALYIPHHARTQEPAPSATTAAVRRYFLRGLHEEGPPYVGLLPLVDGVYAFASRPVLSSEGRSTGTVGRLVVGRKLDEAWRARLARLTFSALTIYDLHHPIPPHAARAVAALRGEESWIDTSNPEHLHGYALLDGVDGLPALLLEVTRPRPSQAFAAAASRSILVAVVVVGVLLAIASLVLIRRVILRPVERLRDGVLALQRGEAPKPSPSWNASSDQADELGQLSGTFQSMSSVLREREGALREMNDELGLLLDHLGQVVLAFDSLGRVRGRVSRQALAFFGRDTLTGEAIDALLFAAEPFEREAFQAWIEAAFTQGPDAWEELRALAPKESKRPHPDGVRLLALSLQPIWLHGALHRVLLLGSDISTQRKLEAARQADAAAHARQLEDVQQRLRSPHLYAAFLTGTEERLTEISFTPHDRALAARHAHTIKGEARLFAEVEIESAATTLEEALSGSPAEQSAALLALKNAIHSAAERARRAALLSEDGGAQRFVQVRDLHELARLARAHQTEAVARLADELCAGSFAQLAAPFTVQAPRWAQDLGRAVDVRVEGGALRIPAAQEGALLEALTHLVRNAVAHGLEEPGHRASLHKPPRGTITLGAANSAAGLSFWVEDDGRGVPRAALAEKAGQPAADVLSLMSQPGLSTAPHTNALAGRGVGVSAARAALQAAGYALKVHSQEGQGTRVDLLPVGTSAAPTE